MPPISAFFCGKPKIGKSYLMIKLSYDINEILFKKKIYAAAITLTTEHWDGYHNEPILIFDDHYKCQDNEQKVDATAVFNAVSCTPFYPPYANLSDKGLPFDSKILLINSNFGYPQTIFLPSALHRRHKHHFICIQNKRGVNPSFDHLEFYYAKEIINPWGGVFVHPFTLIHDIPYSIEEFNLFPFKNQYRKVDYNEIINIIINDYNYEFKMFRLVSTLAS
jgi:hypothetical protein